MLQNISTIRFISKSQGMWVSVRNRTFGKIAKTENTSTKIVLFFFVPANSLPVDANLWWWWLFDGPSGHSNQLLAVGEFEAVAARSLNSSQRIWSCRLCQNVPGCGCNHHNHHTHSDQICHIFHRHQSRPW